MFTRYSKAAFKPRLGEVATKLSLFVSFLSLSLALCGFAIDIPWGRHYYKFPSLLQRLGFFSAVFIIPRRPLEYLSAFLSQLFYYSWTGALVVTAQAWLLSECIDYLLKATNLSPPLRFRQEAGANRRGLDLLYSPILLLVLYTQYAYHFATTLAFLTALLFACLYLKMTLSRTSIFSYLGLYLSLSIILYYLAGGAFLLFAAICAIYELIFISRWKMGLFYLLSAAVIPYVVGLLIFRISIVDAFCNLLPFSWKILYYEARKRAVTIVYLLYLLPPLMLLVCGLWRILGNRLHFIKKHQKGTNESSNLMAKVFSWYKHSPKIRWGIESILLFAIAGIAVFLFYDDNLRTRFKVDYYAYHRMWPELLTVARRQPQRPFYSSRGQQGFISHRPTGL